MQCNGPPVSAYATGPSTFDVYVLLDTSWYSGGCIAQFGALDTVPRYIIFEFATGTTLVQMYTTSVQVYKSL